MEEKEPTEEARVARASDPTAASVCPSRDCAIASTAQAPG